MYIWLYFKVADIQIYWNLIQNSWSSYSSQFLQSTFYSLALPHCLSCSNLKIDYSKFVLLLKNAVVTRGFDFNDDNNNIKFNNTNSLLCEQAKRSHSKFFIFHFLVLKSSAERHSFIWTLQNRILGVLSPNCPQYSWIKCTLLLSEITYLKMLQFYKAF